MYIFNVCVKIVISRKYCCCSIVFPVSPFYKFSHLLVTCMLVATRATTSRRTSTHSSVSEVTLKTAQYPISPGPTQIYIPSMRAGPSLSYFMLISSVTGTQIVPLVSPLKSHYANFQAYILRMTNLTRHKFV